MNGKLDPEERVLSRNFTVYSRDGCPYCEKVEQVLEMTGLNFVIYKLDNTLTEKVLSVSLERDLPFHR